MHIFEKDLFNFIFHPKEVGINKIKYIKKNVYKYYSELSILIETFETINKKLKKSVWAKLSEGISKTNKKERIK